MAKKTTLIKYEFLIILFSGAMALLCAGAPASDSIPYDTGKVSMDELESKVMSTLMYGGSAPVSFSGEGRMKLQFHEFRQCPDYARKDQSWVESNWAGNEDMLRIGMVVRVGRNTVLWSKIGFQNTLPGIYTNSYAVDTTNTFEKNNGFMRNQTRHDALEATATIHEDMCAGLAVRSVFASFWLKMGSILWTEASPLTLWKSQPRTFAWEFLPYEIEQPIDRYYDYNIAKGAKEGRASWHKKALQGINLESIDLPWNLYFNAVYGCYEYFDSDEREFVDWTNDLGYTAVSPPNESKQRGIGDSYHHILHFRLAENKIANGMTLGLNYAGFFVQNDIINDWKFWQTFFGYNAGEKNNNAYALPQGYPDSAFYKEPHIFSVDFKGPVNNHLEMHADVAMSILDTTFVRFVSDTAKNVTVQQWNSWTPVSPALYGHLKSTYGIPASIDLAYISKGFYSPLSFAAPVDAFFPYGSNLVGSGKFLARGEASPYAQNMAGAVVQIAPDIGYGHLKFSYGQHFQPSVARDLIYFPYRLNGQDFFSLFASSYTDNGIDLFDASLPGRYKKRLGDESFHDNTYYHFSGPDAGGMRQDYLASYEGFVPYENEAEAEANFNHANATSIFSRSPYVPQHRKYTFNLEADAAYPINQFMGYHHDFFLSLYGAINGVSTSFTPIAFNQKDQLLWSSYIRFEPAIALADKFYLIGIAGYENWKSDKAWMLSSDSTTAFLSPIDYRDVAYGLGFDWEMSPRVGLHNRIKWMTHSDTYCHDNDWATPIVSLEIKMWY